MFIVYPAIDLMGGQCVRLTQGDFARQSHYITEPQELALCYRKAGSQWLHLIDLDSAKTQGQRPQLETIKGIVRTSGLKVQCGGGIQSHQRLQQIFAAGIERAIVGSLCVKQPQTVHQWLKEFGPERIVLAIDIAYSNNTPHAAIHGWQQLSEKTLWQLLGQFPTAKHLLCTDIAKDGTLQGPNFALYADIQSHFPQLAIQASGGIAALSDIAHLRQSGAAGVILGKALLEGRFNLEQALAQA